MAINEELQLGRAKNAVLSFLEQRLSIPKIYLDADWDGHHIDILAINREGVGDVSAVLLFARKYDDLNDLARIHQGEQIDGLIEEFTSISAQFKYIGVVDILREGRFGSEPVKLSDFLSEKSFAPDGLGRIGFLKIEVPVDAEPSVGLEIKPERFRAKVAKLADEYIQQHEADWELRA